MTGERMRLAEAWRDLPPEWPQDPRPAIGQTLKQLGEKVVVLDDDPTGTQTVHGIPVLTEWPVDMLQLELENDLPAFYILTNSRSMPLAEAKELNRTIAHNLVAASRRAGRRLAVVSRSDSTLRGHFPGEVEALVEGLGQPPDALLLIPFFFEGGRYTIRDVHYVTDGEWLIGVGQTEFAQDPVFGYSSSNLREWVQEKTNGRVLAGSVHSVSIEDIRLGGPDRVRERLEALRSSSVCIVNAAGLRDLEVFTQGLLAAELNGKRYLYRTAASFVPVRCGLAPHPLLRKEEFASVETGGLVIAGSFVPTTTSQIGAALQLCDLTGLELDVGALLDEDRRAGEIRRVADATNRLLAGGNDVMVFTSRRLVAVEKPEENLSIGRRISEGLVEVVQSISVRPRYLVAKGGITASDIATKALHVKRAMVRGQVLPGVPVWELGSESRYPALPYVVFPGNVGDSAALARTVNLWSKCLSPDGA